jgi:ATP-dependent Lon protease
MAGVGVEMCVAFTGIVSLSGTVHRVGGLEDKLRFAHSSPRITTVVVPEGNYEEARELVQRHGLSSLRLLAVGHMVDVIHHLFLGSVAQLPGQFLPASPLLEASCG